MAAGGDDLRRRFYIELIKPSHYDDDGYVIQWRRAWIPSNSLACLYGLAKDAADRRVLGADVEIVVGATDESNAVVRIGRAIRRIRRHAGVVCLVGVQTNQFPRAMDIAADFRRAGIAVIVGGFHVSGSFAMLPDMPAELKSALDMGVTLFDGEGEGRFDELIVDAANDRLEPVYNAMGDLPSLEGQPIPALPASVTRGYAPPIGTIDAGRGCPFQCSFCTIINVQGRKSRYRSADDVERAIRANLDKGIHRFFITDDNFARNKNWEPIFDRFIRLREEDGLDLGFMIQIDTLAYRIPGFVAKAARAGCTRAFIGLESINPDSLAGTDKHQNHVDEYRAMLQSWRDAGVVTYAGYILGFPGETPDTIARDLRVVQSRLPIDQLELFMLTPLPGSADHRALARRGVAMESDLNVYDLEHVTTAHDAMSAEEWRRAYRDAWDLYYSPEHIETLMRRAAAGGFNLLGLMANIIQFYGAPRFENIHPLQGGYFRRKVRRSRRPTLPRENAFLFYPRRLWEFVSTYTRVLAFVLRVNRIRKRVMADPARGDYTDEATRPAERKEALELAPELALAPVAEERAGDDKVTEPMAFGRGERQPEIDRPKVI